MKTRFNSMISYVAWVMKEYKKLTDVKLAEAQLRILESSTCPKTGKTLFLIQFTGKSICPTIPANELYQNEDILLKFSKSDVKKIVEAVKNDEIKLGGSADQFNIKEVSFDRDSKSRLYSFESKNGSVKKFHSSDLYSERDFLLKFNKESIVDISYDAGKQSVLK